MDMLCIAASHDPIGYVAVAGLGLDEIAIARMTGGLESEVRQLLAELDRHGVFSRDRHGRIYSRRMVADAKRTAIAKKNGQNGGNPTLLKRKGNPAWDKGGLNTHKPYASYQEGIIAPSERDDSFSQSEASPLPADRQASASQGMDMDFVRRQLAAIAAADAAQEKQNGHARPGQPAGGPRTAAVAVEFTEDGPGLPD